MTDLGLEKRLGSALPSEESSLGYLFWLSRPRFWLYLAGPVIVGVAYAADSPAELFSPLAVALFAYFLIPANVYLYGINDVFDADIDELNPKKDDKEVRYEGGPLVILSVFAAGAIGLVLIPFLGPAALVPFGLFYLFATEYSAPPFRFKTTPVLDSVSNGLYALPGIAAYAAVAGTYPPAAAMAGGWLWTMAMHTFSAIPDIEPDREAGIRTTATLLGKERTYAYCALVWLAGAIAFGLVHPFLGGVLGVYPLLAIAIARSEVAVDRAYWWFPVINTVVGAVLTMAALWVMLYA
ncbi:prenyltransferase [Halapricum desulfuricans]|uniref:4-hydroxybenzoate polyprenyltransferase or related prenyltransferase n=1 Tax=Halapricum desulfuricans TaxID=2841257 RepID=A0A897NEY9_9EURY|nr:prenyltransferase [Halapricum desulfuricans]QSG10005.1 4-hydroxybenzoate polyprenyltransferase or related prenyltransferase [Halapricum desulfuricans]